MTTVTQRPLILTLDTNGRLIQSQSTEIALNTINAADAGSVLEIGSNLTAALKLGNSDVATTIDASGLLTSLTAQVGKSGHSGVLTLHDADNNETVKITSKDGITSVLEMGQAFAGAPKYLTLNGNGDVNAITGTYGSSSGGDGVLDVKSMDGTGQVHLGGVGGEIASTAFTTNRIPFATGAGSVGAKLGDSETLTFQSNRLAVGVAGGTSGSISAFGGNISTVGGRLQVYANGVSPSDPNALAIIEAFNNGNEAKLNLGTDSGATITPGQLWVRSDTGAVGIDPNSVNVTQYGTVGSAVIRLSSSDATITVGKTNEVGAAMAGTANFYDASNNVSVNVDGASGKVTAVALDVTGLGLGIAHVDASGNFSSSAIVNADVDAAAAIEGTKIVPNFGAQNISTTGTLNTGAATVTSLDAGAGAVTAGSGTFGTTGSGAQVSLTAADASASIAILDASNSSVFSVDQAGYLQSLSGKIGAVTIGVDASGLSVISNVANLTAQSSPTDAANKAYVDAVAQGLSVKGASLAATTGNITLEGEQTIDGVAVAAGNRVLVKAQNNAAQNGIWVVAVGEWTRAQDMNDNAEVPGAFTFVEEGDTYADTGWVCTTDPPVNLGQTAITWAQFSSAGIIEAGKNLNKVGNTLNLNNSVTLGDGSGAVGALYATNGNANTVLIDGSAGSVQAVSFNNTNSSFVAASNGDVTARSLSAASNGASYNFTVDGTTGAVTTASYVMADSLSANTATLTQRVQSPVFANDVSGSETFKADATGNVTATSLTTDTINAVDGDDLAIGSNTNVVINGAVYINASGVVSAPAYHNSNDSFVADASGAVTALSLTSNTINSAASGDTLAITAADGLVTINTNLSVNAAGVLTAPSATIGAAVINADGGSGTSLISNVTDPVDPQDAATRAYVDAAVSGAETKLVAGQELFVGMPLVINSSGQAVRALADAGASYQYCIGICMNNPAVGEEALVLRNGLAAGALSGATPGAAYYVARSDSAPGVYLTKDPGNGAQWILVGYAQSATALMVQVQDYGYVAAA